MVCPDWGTSKAARQFCTNKYINSLGGWQELYVDFAAPAGAPMAARITVQRSDFRTKHRVALDYCLDSVRIAELR